LAIKQVDLAHNPRHDVTSRDLLRPLRRDENVVGADANLQLFYPNRTAQR
jgi:hypothetical protein